jgi:hypothetical protein
MKEIVPEIYLKNHLPNDIFDLYLKLKKNWILYYYSKEPINKKDIFTDLYLLYFYDIESFNEKIKNIFWSEVEYHFNRFDWSCIDIVITSSINWTIYIHVSWFSKYYKINKYRYWQEQELLNNEQVYIKKLKDFLSTYWYKDYDKEKLDFITLDVPWFTFLTKEDLLNVSKKRYDEELKDNWREYLSGDMNLWNIIWNKEKDFRWFVIDELNTWEYLDVWHFLFYWFDMF